jgi:indolepyruvate ferredoxin oxidoreductase
MAAHIDGKGAGDDGDGGPRAEGRGGAYPCAHRRTPDDISAIRVATGECDTLIGGDLVVSAGPRRWA